MTREEWMKQVTDLVMDINPAEIKSYDTDESLKDWCHAWQTAMNMLIVQAPLEPKRWIPVSAKLPMKGKQVLCCNKYGSVFTSELTWSKGYLKFGQHYDVIAWQPLPQPYRAGSEFYEYESVLAWSPLPEPYNPQGSEKKRRRGRPKADYTCAISKRVCPFNDDFWEWISGDVAHDNCPIQSYENNNRIGADGVRRIDDLCKHLIPRN